MWRETKRLCRLHVLFSHRLCMSCTYNIHKAQLVLFVCQRFFSFRVPLLIHSVPKGLATMPRSEHVQADLADIGGRILTERTGIAAKHPHCLRQSTNQGSSTSSTCI